MITFYSTHCPNCQVLEAKLKMKGIEYTENNDVDEMQALGITSVPCLMIDGKLYQFIESINWVNHQ